MGVGMSDYKELIEMLRSRSKAIIHEDAKLFDITEENIRDADASIINEAANAIEQLCTDVARLEAENYSKEQYIAETIGKVIKERDAAIADLKVNWLCAVCKKRVVTREWMRCDSKDFYEAPCEAPTCLNFEWRGVQEVEHEETPT